MSVPNTTCPICNEIIEAGNASCPRCGFKLVGATQTFNPVMVETGETSAQEDVGTPALEVASGPYAGESFIMGDGSFTLGRDPKCDIFLSNMTVSRHHSTITINGNSARIEDAGSTNGTWIDGAIEEEAELKPGTRVQIGTFDMIFKRIK